MTDPTPAPAVASGPSPGRTTPWQESTIIDIRDETAQAKTFRLRLTGPSDHLAGQHYIVRLRAPDGYVAQRSYSVASAPDGTDEIELTVEHLPDGEVSGFLHEVAAVGDTLEVRGPIGRWFVWAGDEPAVLVGGGSGVVPLMAMLRLARRTGVADRLRLVVSARTPADLYYADELPGPETTVVFTRAAPPGSRRTPGRLAAADLPPLPAGGTAFVCGSPGFADAVTDLLVAGGVAPTAIRVERFGATN